MKQNAVKKVKTKAEADDELKKEISSLKALVKKQEKEAKESANVLKEKDSDLEKLKLENKKLVDEAKKGGK